MPFPVNQGPRVFHSCPVAECRSESLERCFGVSAELWGYSYYCLACGWRGLRCDRFIDRPYEESYSLTEREPFNDWPNGQGTYD